MKTMRVILICLGIAMLATTGSASGAVHAPIPETAPKTASQRNLYARVPMIRLLANPWKYNGKKVLTEGVLGFALNDSNLFASKEWMKYGVTSNALALRLEISGKDIEKYASWSGKYVVVQGVFDATDCGDSCAYSGAIKDVTYLHLAE